MPIETAIKAIVAMASLALLGSATGSAGTGAGWSIQVTPNPVAESLLNGVSCSSPSACTAVGTDSTDTFSDRTLAVRWNGRKWTRQVLPTRRAVDSGLGGVSCPRARDCVAVGGSGNGTLVERWTGSAWRIQASGSGHAGGLAAVSCSSPSACTAVGSTGSRALAERWNGIRWVVQHLRSPANSSLTGVSCPSATDCTAVGDYGQPAGGKTFAEHWTEGEWVLQRTRNPTFFSSLGAVSCSAPDACTAVGYDETTTITFPVNALAERWNGRKWTLQTTPSPSRVVSQLSGVSCPSSADCTAVGQYDSGRFGPTLAERWNGKQWIVQDTAKLRPHSGGGQFNGVSCPSPADCTGVGWYVNLLDGLEQTLAERYRA